MMFKLILQDRKGNSLNEGDIVKVSDGHRFNFYAEVKYLANEKAIAPFSTFSFHSFEKVESVPDNAILSTEPRFKIWYVDGDPEIDQSASDHSKYLISWRECETLLEKSCFKIELI